MAEAWLQRALHVPNFPPKEYVWSDFYPFPLALKIFLFIANLACGLRLNDRHTDFVLFNVITLLVVVSSVVYRNHSLDKVFGVFVKDLYNAILGRYFTKKQLTDVEGYAEYIVTSVLLVLAAVFLFIKAAAMPEIEDKQYTEAENWLELLDFPNVVRVLACSVLLLACLFILLPFCLGSTEGEHEFQTTSAIGLYSLKESRSRAILNAGFLKKAYYFFWELGLGPPGDIYQFVGGSFMFYVGLVLLVMPIRALFYLGVLMGALGGGMAAERFLVIWPVQKRHWMRDISYYRRQIVTRLASIARELRRRIPDAKDPRFSSLAIRVAQLRRDASKVLQMEEFSEHFGSLQETLQDEMILEFTELAALEKPRPYNCCVS